MGYAKLLLALLGAALLQLGDCAAAQSAPPYVALLTTMGSIVVRLDPEHAPASVANFLRYVNEKHFDDTLFYRVVPGFVIQAGSYGLDGKSRPTHESIPLEANNGLKNVRGAISMARNDDPNSADAEFFIVLADNPGLDHKPDDPGNTTGYAVFGRVVQGMDIVDMIAGVPLGGTGPFGAAAPGTPVVINRTLLLPMTTPR